MYQGPRHRPPIRPMMTSPNGNIFRVTGHLCGEFTVPGEFPAQKPVTRSFDVFFDLRMNERLSEQSWGWWFETLSRPLWHHCNALAYKSTIAAKSHMWHFGAYNSLGICCVGCFNNGVLRKHSAVLSFSITKREMIYKADECWKYFLLWTVHLLFPLFFDELVIFKWPGYHTSLVYSNTRSGEHQCNQIMVYWMTCLQSIPYKQDTLTITVYNTQPEKILTRETFMAIANCIYLMMTSSNGNFFRVTGPWCAEFTGDIHRSPVNSPHKGQWRGALMFSLICAWINAWVHNREAGD